jgi:predicted aspartyl protease
METTSEGKGILAVKLLGPGNITVKTWNNGLSDIGSNTLIPHGSTLYNQVANLAKGDTVLFIGSFAQGAEDYILEPSLTEEGSMSSPEFIFTFTSIRKITDSDQSLDHGNTVQTETSRPPQEVPVDTPNTVPPPSKESVSDQSHGSQSDAYASEIRLEKQGGVYTLPVRINGVITLNFVLDSGAADVAIPVDVVCTILRAGTIKESDFLPGQVYSLADGSELKSPRFLIRELEFGGIKISNVQASVAPITGQLLLGQSLLERLDGWSMDNRRHVLVLRSREQSPTGSTPLPPPQRFIQEVKISYESEATPYVIGMINYARDEAKLSSISNKLDGLPKPQRGDKVQARKLNDEALALMRRSQDAEAIPILEYAHRADPLDVEIANNLASAYFNTSFTNNDFTRAKSMLVDTLRLKPDRYIAWANLGYAFAMEGNKFAATNCYINFCRFSKDRERSLQILAKGTNDPNPVLAQAFAEAHKYVSTNLFSVGSPKESVSDQSHASQMDAMKSFIYDYLRANENKEMDKVLSFYGDTVDYYSKGMVLRSYIRQDKETYFKFCRKLSYTLADDLRIVNLGDPEKITLTFTYSFLIESSKKNISGTAKNTWEIEKFNSNPKIIAEKQIVIDRKEARNFGY